MVVDEILHRLNCQEKRKSVFKYTRSHVYCTYTYMFWNEGGGDNLRDFFRVDTYTDKSNVMFGISGCLIMENNASYLFICPQPRLKLKYVEIQIRVGSRGGGCFPSAKQWTTGKGCFMKCGGGSQIILLELSFSSPFQLIINSFFYRSLYDNSIIWYQHWFLIDTIHNVDIENCYENNKVCGFH